MQINLSPGEVKYLVQLIEDHQEEIKDNNFKIIVKDIKDRLQKVLGE